MSTSERANDDSFVNVWFDNGDGVASGGGHLKDFYTTWNNKSSAQFTDQVLIGADALRRLYPKHHLVMSSDYRINILSHPAVQAKPMEKTPLVTNLLFVPLARKFGTLPGVLVDQVRFGAFEVAWEGYDFLMFVVLISTTYSTYAQHYILHERSEDPGRLLLKTVGAWAEELHDEIWVFNQGFWSKDHGLWNEVQKANWDDIIMKEAYKKALQKDIYGFFASEEVYRKLAIPWKRGLIMHGPPGNGKTITLKAVMKTCGDKGIAPLYVRSFQSYKGEEGAMADVFSKARLISPCVLVFEDLDSLINDRNRSFFLNQLDGIEGNDGLLIIGTTNHFDRLDPGLSSRPSRFDRKYLFDDPDREERALYAQYWQNKLRDNNEIAFPDVLIYEVADGTAKFSFAYLKEAFVSSLVILATYEGAKPTFSSVLKDQIDTLRKQLDKSIRTVTITTYNNAAAPQQQPVGRGIRSLSGAFSDSSDRGEGGRIVFTRPNNVNGAAPRGPGARHLLREVSNNLKSGEGPKIFDIAPPGPSVPAGVPPQLQFSDGNRPPFPDLGPILYEQGRYFHN